MMLEEELIQMASDRYIIVNMAPEDGIDMPSAIFTDKNVSPGAVRLYALVADADDDSIPDKWYAEQLNISRGTLYKYKRELRNAGYIK